MSSKSRQTNYALSTQIVNELKEDGVIVDPYSKVYEEDRTENGGTGDRLQFKKVNDEINRIQRILKILTGDERAELTEEVPVIDFAHPENTGFDMVYERLQSGLIDERSIKHISMPTDEKEPSSVERHLRNGEQIINRATLGERSFMGCHFWNSNSMAVDEFNLQTSPYRNYEGSNDWVYKGTYVGGASGFSTSTDDIRPYRTDTVQSINAESFEGGVLDIILVTGNTTETIPLKEGLFIPKGSTGEENILICNSQSEEGPDISSLVIKRGFDSYVTTGGVSSVAYGESFPTNMNGFLITRESLVRQYLNIERNYYSKASGLLNGLWSEPYDYTDTGNGYRVSKWKFSNDWMKAQEDGVNIPIGSHYYRGCIINENRGSIYESPMKITSDEERSFTFAGEQLSGKATYIGTRFLGNDLDALMSPYMIPEATWNYRSLYKINNIVYYDDYKNNGSMKKQGVTLRSTEGNFNFEKYFNDFIACKSGNVFTLDINNSNIAYNYKKYNEIDNDLASYGLNAVGDTVSNTMYSFGTGNSLLYSSADYFAHMTYYKILNTAGNTVLNGRGAERLQLTFRDPYNLLTTNETSNNVVLLYDKPYTHMPTDLWLVSRTDLGINKGESGANYNGSLVTFSKVGSSPINDRVITFKCTDTKTFLGSEVNTIRIKDDVHSSGYDVSVNRNSWYEYSYAYNKNYTYPNEIHHIPIDASYLYETNPLKLEKPMYLFIKLTFKYRAREIADAVNSMWNFLSVTSVSDHDKHDGTTYSSSDGSIYVSLQGHFKTVIGLAWDALWDKTEEMNVFIKLPVWETIGENGDQSSALSEKTRMDNWKKASHNDGEQGVFNLGPLTVTITCRKVSYNLPNVYAYKLSPFTVNTGISFHGQDNNVIQLSESSTISFSYPKSFMEFNPNDRTESDGYPFYDQNSGPLLLLDSSIIVGLPQVDSLSQLGTLSDRFNVYGDKAVRMTTLYNQYNAENGSAVGLWKSTLYNVFKDWRLSDGESPLRFESLLTLIDGIDELRKTGISLDGLNLSYSKDGSIMPITNTDLDKLWNVLDNRTIVGTYKYEYNTVELTSSHTFESLLSAEEATMTAEGTPHERKSLLEVREIVRPILDANTVPTLDTFKQMDEVFGDNGAFIRIGSSDSAMSVSDSLVAVEKQLIDSALLRYHTSKWNYENLGVFTVNDYEDSMDRDAFKATFKDKNTLLAGEIKLLALFGLNWDKLPVGTARTAVKTARFLAVDGNKKTFLNTIMGTDYDSYSKALDVYARQRADALRTTKGWGGDSTEYDVDMDILKALAEYLKGKLVGYTVREDTKVLSDGVKFVKGDSAVDGQKNSLYYKRYLYLNNRLNKVDGHLNKASMLINNRTALTSMDVNTQNKISSYEDYLSVVPISRMTPLTYVPKQKAKFSDDMLFGRFYNTELLDAMRAELGRNCSLTCTKCAIADNCPYYDHNVLLNEYIPSEERMTIFVKDNKLDLIGYETDLVEGYYTSPSLMTEDGTETLNPDYLKAMHKQYNTVFNVDGSQVYDGLVLGQTIDDMNNSLQGENLGLDEEGMGWIVGGRYGTVRENLIKNYDNIKNNVEQPIPDKTVLYDTVFVEDEETEFNYRISRHSYEVSVDIDGKKFEGRTKIMIPTGLKALDEAPDDADVYLISDDVVVDGENITPVIYLNNAYVVRGMIRFDLEDDDGTDEATPTDRKLYAKDVAQLAINVIKGNLKDKPIYSNGGEDLSDIDQIWMDTYEKKVNVDGREAWLELEGRPREETFHQELLCNVDSFNRALLLSGKPLASNYINYLRKVTIPMIEEETEMGLIRTVKWTKYGGEETVEKKKRLLQHMKTNLRLVVATYDK